MARKKIKWIVDVGGLRIFMSDRRWDSFRRLGGSEDPHLSECQRRCHAAVVLNRDALSVFRSFWIGVSGDRTERRSWDSGAAIPDELRLP